MSWQHILGHQELVESFRRVVSGQRLAHAYLFCGPEGVGKKRFATELGKALLCESPPGGQPLTACDQCPSCKLVEAKTHPDFFMMHRPEEKNEMPIEVIRELCQGFGLTAARGRGKIAILDDADDLNEEGSNCFLKTLEEPPPQSVFILIGTDSHRQLPTIRSRCQLIRFAPLPESIVIDLLKAQGVPAGKYLNLAARAGQGSPGFALALADESLWRFHHSFITTLGQPRPNTVNLAREFTEFAEEAGKETAQQRRRASLVLRLFLTSLTDALTIGLGKPVMGYEPDELERLRGLARRADPDKIMRMVNRCLEAEGHLSRYISLALVLEALVDALGQILEGSAPPR